jgi:hypothetical protein
VPVHDRLGLGVLPLDEQPPDFRQRREGVGPVGVLARARPHAGFVERNPLLVDAAEDHRAEPAVAERQRSGEVPGGGVKPDAMLGRGEAGGKGEAEHQGKPAEWGMHESGGSVRQYLGRLKRAHFCLGSAAARAYGSVSR